MNIQAVDTQVKAFISQSQIKMVIGGEKVAALSGKTYVDHNPSTGEKLADIASGGDEDVNRAVEAARAAMAGPWGRMSPAEREKLMRRFAQIVEEHGEELAQLESLDNGKPLSHTRLIDSRVAANNIYHFSGWPSKIFGQTVPVSIPDMFVYTRREPIGVVALIIPWNYPLIHAAQKISPSLAAGNAIILKPASAAPLCCVRLAELGLEAGLPAGVFNVITGPGGVIGRALSTHVGVNKIQVTGSTEVGRQIIQNSVGNIKRLTLEPVSDRE